MAETPKAAGSELTYEFRKETPYGGRLDRQHFPDKSEASALYALRGTAVDDLISTRRSLQILLGGTARARRITRDPNITFEVPESIRKLYAGDEDREIQFRQLSQGEIPFDANLRARMVTGLVHVSAMIARYERAIRFIEKDFWADDSISKEFYLSRVRPQELALDRGNRDLSLLNLWETQKRHWLTDHGMDDVLAVLAGQRAALLDRYRLLAIPVRGKSLHQRFMEAMEAREFPSPEKAEAPVEHRLPDGTSPIPMPRAYQTLVSSHLDQLRTPEGMIALSSMVRELSPMIDEALLESLSGNTERLEDLGRDPEYRDGKNDSLRELAREDALWDGARVKYAYLGDQIDWKGPRSRLTEEFRRSDQRRKAVRYTAYGLGIGVGVMAFVASAGTEGAVFGIAARTLFIASGSLASMGSLEEYIDARKAARVQKQMFLGTTRTGSADRMTNSVLMEQTQFTSLVSTVALLGCDLPMLTVLAKGRQIVGSGAKIFVKIAEPELATLRNAVEEVAARAEALAPMGQALVGMARAMLGMGEPIEHVIPMKDAIRLAAHSLKISAAAVRAKLEANPMVGGLVRGWCDRMAADPTFVATMVREQVVGASLQLVGEYQARGDRFNRELGQVGFNEVVGSLSTAALVWIATPTLAAQAKAAVLRRPQTIFDPGFTGKERLATFFDRGKTNFLVGFGVSAGVSGITQGIEVLRDGDKDGQSLKDRLEGIGENGLFTAAFMGVSSNARYQVLGYVNRNIGRYLKSHDGARMVLTRASIANNYFGSWSYVKLLKLTGVQKDSGLVVAPDDAPTSAPSASSNGPEPAGDISGLRASELDGAYFRIKPAGGDEGYLLDFLK